MEWVRGWMEAWRWMEAWWEAWREWVRGAGCGVRGAGVDGGVEVEGGVVGGVDVGAVRSERSKRPRVRSRPGAHASLIARPPPQPTRVGRASLRATNDSRGFTRKEHAGVSTATTM